MRVWAWVAVGFLVSGAALAGDGPQRITVVRLYEVHADSVAGLPRVEVDGATQRRAPRSDVASFLGIDESRVTLVETSFAVDVSPKITTRAGEPSYAIRFCTDRGGKVTPEVDVRAAQGARLLLGRTWRGKRYVLAIEDGLAPDTADIAGMQLDLRSEGEGRESEDASPVLRTSFRCPADDEVWRILRP